MGEDREMAPESNLEASPVINTLQWLEHCHENGVEVNDAEEERFQLHADENGPTHHPSAPPDEVFFTIILLKFSIRVLHSPNLTSAAWLSFKIEFLHLGLSSSFIRLIAYFCNFMAFMLDII